MLFSLTLISAGLEPTSPNTRDTTHIVGKIELTPRPRKVLGKARGEKKIESPQLKQKGALVSFTLLQIQNVGLARDSISDEL